ncbi:MAG: glycosyltransferase family 4 protein [Candidatus Zhuqueibacterota bacterium]
MKLFWIVQKDLLQDLDSATWIEPSRILTEQGFQVLLIHANQNGATIRNDSPALNARKIRVINRFPLMSISFHFQVLFRILYWVFSEKPVIVLTHPITALFLLPAILLSRLARIKTKFVLDIRTLPVGSFGLSGKIKTQIIYLSILAGKLFFDGITVITPALKTKLVGRYNISPDKIGIWSSGVNTTLFNSESRRKQFENGEFTVLYHGVMAENRGIIETICAMEIVAKEAEPITLILVGAGPSRDKIEHLIREKNLQDCVKLVPPVPQDEIPNYIQAADCGILPLPDYEFWRISSPLKLFEYLAMSRPVIVSRIEAHVSVLQDNSAGIYLPDVTPERIAETILTAYSHRGQLHEWGEAGRRLVLDKFTWHHQTEKLSTYLKKLN